MQKKAFISKGIVATNKSQVHSPINLFKFYLILYVS
jgi:hypothetical protein